MKVVHLLPALEQGGVESVVCDLNRVLTSAGCSSVVISNGGKMVERIERDGGRHLALDLKTKNPLSYFTRALGLRRLLKKERPDLVCAHSRVPAWLFLWANRGLGLPWITYAHGANSVSRYSEVMTRGDLVVSPSRFLADYLKKSYNLSETRLRIVPNPVDTTRFDPERLDRGFVEDKRREWGLAAAEHVVMAIGRLTPVKGLDHLIRTTPRTTKLVIVGGADRHHLGYERKLKEMAGPNVVFAGPQTKIPECISLADEVVSANTTKPESFGLSIVEAYAMNKPVRAKRFGGAAEVMEAVERRGAASFREAVIALYGMERFAKQTLAVYRQALDMV